MVLAAAESSTASILSAVFAGGALVAALVLGWLNLRRARKGPDPVPKWSFDHVTDYQYILRLTGADVHDVAVHPDEGIRLVGERMEFPTFVENQVAVFYYGPDESAPTPHLTVTYRLGSEKEARTWSTDVPPMR